MILRWNDSLRPASRSLLIVVLIALNGGLSAEESNRHRSFLYVATYSPLDGEGIFVAPVTADGGLGTLRPTGGLKSPAALVIHPRGKFLYATTLMADADDKLTGGIVAFAIHADTGELREIDRQSSGGMGPCYLSVDSQGRCLLVAHCGSASVACIPLKPDGRFGESSTVLPHIGESRNSEGKPQAHSILATPGDRFAIAADLGLDRLFVYRLKCEESRLSPHDPPFAELPPGSGPRHLAFHPQGRYFYAVNELGNSITACQFDPETGWLRPIQSLSTLPDDFTGESYAAEIQVHPSGRFLYASNRGHDSLTSFAIDPHSGRLRRIEQIPSRGAFPRHFAISPNGETMFVANQKSNQLTVFQVNLGTGRLHSKGLPVPVPLPVCIKFFSGR